MERRTMLLVLGPVLLVTGFVLQLVGLATPFWSHLNSNILDINYGLWQSCFAGVCVGVDPNDELRVTQAMSTLGVLLAVSSTAVAVFCTIRVLRLHFVPASVSRLVLVLGLIAATCTEIASIIWAAKLHSDLNHFTNQSFQLGYSFVLNVLAGILYVLAVGVWYLGFSVASRTNQAQLLGSSAQLT